MFVYVAALFWIEQEVVWHKLVDLLFTCPQIIQAPKLDVLSIFMDCYYLILKYTVRDIVLHIELCQAAVGGLILLSGYKIDVLPCPLGLTQISKKLKFRTYYSQGLIGKK